MSGPRLRERAPALVVATAIATLVLCGCLAGPVADDDTAPAARCAGYDDVDGHRYRFDDLSARWLTAVTTCAAGGGFLAIVDTEAEREALEDYANTDIWIGTADLDRDGAWRHVDGTKARPVWGDPDDDSIGGYCVAMHEDGQDYAERCADTRPFVCECAP